MRRFFTDTSATPSFPSLAVLPKDRHQLFDLLVAVLGTATLDRLADAGSDVLLQDDLADFVECTRRGGQLHQDIDAVFLILDHATNRFDLSDDTSKSVVELLFLVVGQHSWRLLDRLAFQEARF